MPGPWRLESEEESDKYGEAYDTIRANNKGTD